MRRALGATLAVLFSGLTLSDASAAQVALGLSLIGIALAILALVLVLRLMHADGKKADDQVEQLGHLTDRAARLDRNR